MHEKKLVKNKKSWIRARILLSDGIEHYLLFMKFILQTSDKLLYCLLSIVFWHHDVSSNDQFTSKLEVWLAIKHWYKIKLKSKLKSTESVISYDSWIPPAGSLTSPANMWQQAHQEIYQEKQNNNYSDQYYLLKNWSRARYCCCCCCCCCGNIIPCTQYIATWWLLAMRQTDNQLILVSRF